MTAPGSGEQITAELAGALHSVGYRGTWSAVAALLPVVEAYATRKAAEELRAAANEWAYLTERSAPVQRFLRARADALTATPNHGTDATT